MELALFEMPVKAAVSRHTVYMRKWRKENPERVRDIKKRSAAKAHEANPERERARQRRRHAADPQKALERERRWKKNNPGLVRAKKLRRKYREQQRTPKWLDARELNAVWLNCPPRKHVDHIVPIEGITAEGYKISGLNVPWNLQYLEPTTNRQKSRRMRAVDMAICEMTRPG